MEQINIDLGFNGWDLIAGISGGVSQIFEQMSPLIYTFAGLAIALFIVSYIIELFKEKDDNNGKDDNRII
jgi:uncharacterized membrane protein YuzA (DUF378 family)